MPEKRTSCTGHSQEVLISNFEAEAIASTFLRQELGNICMYVRLFARFWLLSVKRCQEISRAQEIQLGVHGTLEKHNHKTFLSELDLFAMLFGFWEVVELFLATGARCKASIGGSSHVGRAGTYWRQSVAYSSWGWRVWRSWILFGHQPLEDQSWPMETTSQHQPIPLWFFLTSSWIHA